MLFPRSIVFALVAFSFSVEATSKKPAKHANHQQCAAPKTVTQTRIVTVTQGVAATATAGTNNNKANTKTATAAAQTTAVTGSKATTAATSTKTTAATTGNNADPQKSTTLDPRVLAAGFANNGQDVPAAGQVPSLTSTNNFINFCLTTPNLPITNGKQITTGSCNPAPIGVIPSIDKMPSSKFTFPTNFATLKAGTSFTISMAIQNMQTGFFVNAQESYFAAPQQLNSAGLIQGHSHVVIEQLTSLAQTTPTNPKNFAFFKGLNEAAAGGKLTADVTAGLAPGFYKLSSINTSSNHQPVIVPVAQHGSLDDVVYFTVTANGAATGATNGATTGKAATTPKAATSAKAASTAKATSKTGKRRPLNRTA